MAKLQTMSDDVYEAIEIEAKYAGYLKRQQADIDAFQKTKNLKSKKTLIMLLIGGLSREWYKSCLKSARRQSEKHHE